MHVDMCVAEPCGFTTTRCASTHHLFCTSMQPLIHSIHGSACSFITVFVTLFAVVIAITKDLPDVEGDKKYGIETFATRLGVRCGQDSNAGPHYVKGAAEGRGEMQAVVNAHGAGSQQGAHKCFLVGPCSPAQVASAFHRASVHASAHASQPSFLNSAHRSSVSSLIIPGCALGPPFTVPAGRWPSLGLACCC